MKITVPTISTVVMVFLLDSPYWRVYKIRLLGQVIISPVLLLANRGVPKGGVHSRNSRGVSQAGCPRQPRYRHSRGRRNNLRLKPRNLSRTVANFLLVARRYRQSLRRQLRMFRSVLKGGILPNRQRYLLVLRPRHDPLKCRYNKQCRRNLKKCTKRKRIEEPRFLRERKLV